MRTLKRISLKEIEFNDADGSVRALVAPYYSVDKQGDFEFPGAFGEQPIIISAYGHGSWNGVLPVGKGRIFDQADLGGVMEGKFFLDTALGSETYKTVKNVGDLQEWSFALPDIESEIRSLREWVAAGVPLVANGFTEDSKIRGLRKIRVNEVSPVLMGAGNGTRTLDIKSSIPILDHFEVVASDCRGLVDRIKDVAQLREADGRHPSEATLKRTRALRASFEDLIRELDRVGEKHDELIAEVLRFEQFRARRFA